MEIKPEVASLFIKTLLDDDYGVNSETYRMLCGMFGADKACAALLATVETAGEDERCFLPPDYATMV